MKRYIITAAQEVETAMDPEHLGKKILVAGTDTMQVSDGYHTMDELYDHRITLFITLCRKMTEFGAFEDASRIWRSKLHYDGSGYEGWFIMGIDTEPGKQKSYHLPIGLWEETNFVLNTLDKSPEWDGHTSADVLERLKQI